MRVIVATMPYGIMYNYAKFVAFIQIWNIFMRFCWTNTRVLKTSENVHDLFVHHFLSLLAGAFLALPIPGLMPRELRPCKGGTRLPAPFEIWPFSPGSLNFFIGAPQNNFSCSLNLFWYLPQYLWIGSLNWNQCRSVQSVYFCVKMRSKARRKISMV